eukprot:gene14375-biopygen8281
MRKGQAWRWGMIANGRLCGLSPHSRGEREGLPMKDYADFPQTTNGAARRPHSVPASPSPARRDGVGWGDSRAGVSLGIPTAIDITASSLCVSVSWYRRRFPTAEDVSIVPAFGAARGTASSHLPAMVQKRSRAMRFILELGSIRPDAPALS